MSASKAIITASAQPIGRHATAGEQAGGLVLLNSDLARFINGTVLPVNGGFTVGLATGQIDLGLFALTPETHSD